MYTCGRGTDGYGTLLPALFQAGRDDPALVGRITACATSRRSIDALAAKADGLGRQLGWRPAIDLWPRAGSDPAAYRQLIEHNATAASEDRFDLALVAVPDHLHHAIARELIEAGIHTLLVKPFVTRVQDGQQLVDLAASREIVGMVEFHKRWDRSNLVMRDALAAGRVGQPLYFHIEYSQRKTIPEDVFAAWVRDTDIFQYLGVHYVDMVFFLTGALPRRVMATAQHAYLAAQGIDTPDAIETVIEWERGGRRFVSTHLTHWVDPNATTAMSDQKIEVVGTGGRIECDQKHRGIQIVTDARGVEDLNPYFSSLFGPPGGDCRFDGYGYQSVLSFLRDVRDVAGGKRSAASLDRHRPTFRQALVSTAVVQANRTSLASGSQWVAVDPSVAASVGSSRDN